MLFSSKIMAQNLFSESTHHYGYCKLIKNCFHMVDNEYYIKFSSQDRKKLALWHLMARRVRWFPVAFLADCLGSGCTAEPLPLQHHITVHHYQQKYGICKRSEIGKIHHRRLNNTKHHELREMSC